MIMPTLQEKYPNVHYVISKVIKEQIPDIEFINSDLYINLIKKIYAHYGLRDGDLEQTYILDYMSVCEFINKEYSIYKLQNS